MGDQPKKGLLKPSPKQIIILISKFPYNHRLAVESFNKSTKQFNFTALRAYIDII